MLLLNSITRISAHTQKRNLYEAFTKGETGTRHCEHGLMAAVRRPSARSIPCLSSGRTLTTRVRLVAKQRVKQQGYQPKRSSTHPPIHPPNPSTTLTTRRAEGDVRSGAGQTRDVMTRGDVITGSTSHLRTAHSKCWWQSVTS